MPLNNKDAASLQKRVVPRKNEKSPSQLSHKSLPADNKSRPVDKTAVPANIPPERLNLNVEYGMEMKSKNQLMLVKPNIDNVESSSVVKDNRQFSSRFKISAHRELQQLPLLKEASLADRDGLLIDKIRQACVVFNWNDLTSDIKYKEIKKKALIEISEYIGSMGSHINNEAIYKELLCMVGTNIFRGLAPSIVSGGDIDAEDEEPLLEPAWPHLQHVYEIFLRFIEHKEFSVSIAKNHIDHNFVIYLMELFDSEDPREREYLKTIVHRIYGKMVNQRFFIRKQINHYFLRQIYEDDNFRGTNEFLEILGSIINGFQVPLKEEHKVFLRRILLPLHKVRTLALFHPPLSYCVTEFITKDRSLIKVVVEGLLKFWPKTASLKEMLFLNELEEILVLSDAESVKSMIKTVADQLARCVGSPHFQVAERALYLWQNSQLQVIFNKNIGVVLPATFPALCQAKQHWNKSIHSLVYNAMKIMMDVDLKLFDECTSRFKEEKKKDLESLKRHRDWWTLVERAAKKNPLYTQFSNSNGTVVAMVPQTNHNGPNPLSSGNNDKAGPDTITSPLPASIPTTASATITATAPVLTQSSRKQSPALKSTARTSSK